MVILFVHYRRFSCFHSIIIILFIPLELLSSRAQNISCKFDPCVTRPCYKDQVIKMKSIRKATIGTFNINQLLEVRGSFTLLM